MIVSVNIKFVSHIHRNLCTRITHHINPNPSSPPPRTAPQTQTLPIWPILLPWPVTIVPLYPLPLLVVGFAVENPPILPITPPNPPTLVV